MKIDSRTDATTSGLMPRYYHKGVPLSDLILAYVPESELLTYAEAQALALKRDRQAAEQLRLSMPESETLREAKHWSTGSLREHAGLRCWEPWSAVGKT